MTNFRILPRTLTHLSAYVHVYIAVYIYILFVYYISYTTRRGFCTLVPSLTLGAHAQEGYGTCPVCLSVCLSVCLLPLSCQHRSFLRSKYGTYGTGLGFPSFITRGFSKKPSVGKLWREKANMQMSSYRSRQVLARFEYRAYIKLTGGTLGKRSLFSPFCTSWMLLWRLLLVFTLLIPRSRTARASACFSVDGSF